MDKEFKFFIIALFCSIVAYLIPLYFGKAWLGLFLLLLVGISFLVGLVKYFSSNREARIERTIFSTFAFVLVFFHALSFTHDYGRRDYQKKVLVEIRQTVEEGITKSMVQKPLIYVLAEYHQQEKYSLIEIADQILSDNLLEDKSFNEVPDQVKPDNAMKYFYEKNKDANTLKVIGVSKVVQGVVDNFKNYDNQTGKLQLEVTLTESGVTYEVVN